MWHKLFFFNCFIFVFLRTSSFQLNQRDCVCFCCSTAALLQRPFRLLYVLFYPCFSILYALFYPVFLFILQFFILVFLLILYFCFILLFIFLFAVFGKKTLPQLFLTLTFCAGALLTINSSYFQHFSFLSLNEKQMHIGTVSRHTV